MSNYNRHNWDVLLQDFKYEFKKEELIRDYVYYMFDKTSQIFEYEGLPETINAYDLERILQFCGTATFVKHEGKIYALRGGLGGILDYNYFPTLSIIANPYLKLDGTFTIGKDCEIIRNDRMIQGLVPIFSRYATLLAENDLSYRNALITLRVIDIVTADNDVSRNSLVESFKKIEEGKEFFVIGTSNFASDSIKSNPYGGTTHNTLSDLIESKQYLMANWWIELGLNANYNMKRESLNDDELSVNELSLFPFVDNMLKQREEGIEKVNKMFGLNISVKKSSSWLKIEEEVEKSMDEEESNETERNDFNNSDTGDNEESSN